MYKLLPTIFLLITAATSTPTPVDLASRACTTLAPSSIDILSLDNPDTPSVGTHFALSRETNPSHNTKSVALTFTNIPTSATGCILQLAIPALTQENQIASGPATQADIWSTEPWNSGTVPTWNHPPVKDQMVSTARFPTEKTDSAQVSWLASNSCSETMSFFVELSGWQSGEGDVNFENQVGGGGDDLGFRMVYGC